MKIDLDNCCVYFLTYNNEEREKHMFKEFGDNIIKVDSRSDSSRFRPETSGWSRAIDTAVKI